MDKKIQKQASPGNRYYKDLILCSTPLLVMCCFFYGLRPLLVAAVAVATSNLLDRAVAFLRDREYDPHEHSSECFAMLLALIMPATVPYHVVVVSVVAGVLLGKEVFGGVGCYPFHPTAVAYAVAAVSWPETMFRYPKPFTQLPLGDAGSVATVESASSTLKNGGLPLIDTMNLLLGNYAGPMAVCFVLVILACGLFLLVRGDIDLFTPLCFLGAAAAFVWVFPRLGGLAAGWPWEAVDVRTTVLKYEMLSGAMIFAAVFLVCEPVTVPKSVLSRCVYGLGLGLMTMLLRYYGSYETGVCFALLLMNSLSGWLDRAVMRMAGKREVRRLEQ